MSSNASEAELPDDLSEALFLAAPRLGRFGRPLHYYRSLGSSNDVALAFAAAGAPEGTVVVAGMQTAGRGRRGREWFSPPGAGLYTSIVFRPGEWHRERHGSASSSLTLMAGVALADAIRASTGLATEIKWPNDLLVDGRKLAGILAEASGSAPPFDHIVVGLGVNLTRAAYPHEIASRATSIEHELGRLPDRGLVLAETLAAMSSSHEALIEGRFDAILSRWREWSPSSRGASVEWTTPAGAMRGTTAGIDDRGALLVRTAGGIETIVGGEVKWL